MGKKIIHGNEARAALLRGVDALADTVKVTLGPRGNLVIMGRRRIGQSPQATKDGVTVANFCDPLLPEEQLGSDLVREAAQKTVEKAGDGTTTATVLAQALIHAGIQQMAAKHPPAALERGVKTAVAQVCLNLEKLAIPAEGQMLEQVAAISANGDVGIGQLVARAIAQVGRDGIVTCQESRSLDTYLETTTGLQFLNGYLSPAFINSTEKPECVFTDSLVLMYEGRIGGAKAVVNAIKLAHGLSKPLLVIAGDYEPEALGTLAINKLKGGVSLCAVRADGFGDRRKEILRDIAVLTGGVAITEDSGLKLENITEEQLGKASRVHVTEYRTTISGGASDPAAVTVRAEEIRGQIERAESADVKVLLERRLSGLIGGIAVIKVGATTEAEMREKKDRVEDAMFATKAAAESGIVPGGGLALLLASRAISVTAGNAGENAGAQIVRDACEVPLLTIADNAGEAGRAIVAKVLELNTPSITSPVVEAQGYNAATGRYELMIPAGIIDPLKVVREALSNAASVACVVLRCGALIAEVEEKNVSQV